MYIDSHAFMASEQLNDVTDDVVKH